MSKQRKNDPIDSLAEGYEQMLERAVKDAYHSEEKAEHLLHDLIHDARDKAVELGELTHHEADRIAKYLARDLNDVKTYLSETGHEIKDWLGFETSLLEVEILELLLKAADDTTVDLLLLKAAAHDGEKYLVDQVTGHSSYVSCSPVVRRSWARYWVSFTASSPRTWSRKRAIPTQWPRQARSP